MRHFGDVYVYSSRPLIATPFGVCAPSASVFVFRVVSRVRWRGRNRVHHCIAKLHINMPIVILVVAEGTINGILGFKIVQKCWGLRWGKAKVHQPLWCKAECKVYQTLLSPLHTAVDFARHASFLAFNLP